MAQYYVIPCIVNILVVRVLLVNLAVCIELQKKKGKEKKKTMVEMPSKFPLLMHSI